MIKKTAQIGIVLLGFFVFLSLPGGLKPLSAYNTEKVIIIFMGGVRNSEVVEDPTHQYIPKIWNNIRPHGVLYNNYYNMGFGDFEPGTCQALMGVRRDENKLIPWRGFLPSVFEYYRKDRSVPQNTVWALIGQYNNIEIDYSYHPAYGESYSSSIWLNPYYDDQETFKEAIRVMNRDEPSLMFIEFFEPDIEAQHVNNPGLPDSIAFANYTHAIMVVDSLIDLIWTKVQTDTVYSGKTALIITDAHGRNSPLYGGFQWHGDACNGCRRLPFLAVGPDFKVGETIDIRGDLIDISPTIGELLSFDPVFARGRILEEMFVNPLQKSPKDHQNLYSVMSQFQNNEVLLSQQGFYSHSPFIESIGDVVHVIWTQRDNSSTLEAWNIMYTKSLDGGDTWDEPVPILATTDPTRKVITVASLSGDESGIGIVSSLYRWDRYWAGDSVWVWGSEAKASHDGSEWPENSTNILNKQPTTIDNIPVCSLSDSLWVTVFLTKRYNRDFSTSIDIGENWFNLLVDTGPPRPWVHTPRPFTPSIISRDRLYYIETLRDMDYSRLLFFSSEGNEIELRSIVDDTNGEAFFPQLAYSDSTLYCVWSDDRDGHWEVYFTRSTDQGSSWISPRRLSQSEVNTWYTAIEAQHDTLLVVWEDYRDGASSIYKKVSFDGGFHWSEDYPEVTSQGLSTVPKLSSSEGSYYMVWQDYRSGTWEVYFKKVDIDLPVSIEGDDPGGDVQIPVSMSLSQNYPNPFNPQTEISFYVPGTEAVPVTLKVYNVRGELIKVLTDGNCKPGRHEIIWDGTDQENRPVASGVYLYTLNMMSGRVTRKMLLAR